MKITIVGTVHESSEKFNQMKAIWDACTAANIEVPHEVDTFFDNDEPPDEEPDTIDLEDKDYVKTFTSGTGGGFIIDIDALTGEYDLNEIKYLRFTAHE